MERSKRNGALAVLMLLLIFLSIYLGFLMSVEPERRQVLVGDVGESDGMIFRFTFSDLQERFNETEFQERYYVNETVYLEELAILPKHNPDVEIYMRNNSYRGLHFMVLGYEDVGGLYMDRDDVAQDMEDELTWVLAYIGHEELMRDYYLDDNDFATIDVFFNMMFFCAFLAFIVLYAFAIFFRKGWLVENFRIVDSHIEFYVGLGIMYPGIGFGILSIWALARNLSPPGAICLTVVIIMLLIGFYVLSSAVKRYSQ